MREPSLAPVVDARYRLTPRDLLDGPTKVKIRNVSVQGVEAARPVLHFEPELRPLALDPEQCNDLARITRSAIHRDWIGTELVLAAVEGPNGYEVGLFDVDEQPEVDPDLAVGIHAGRSASDRIRSWLLVLIIALLVLFAYQLEQSDQFWQKLTEWFTGL